MNKIEIKNNKFKVLSTDDLLKIKVVNEENNLVTKLNIEVLESTIVDIFYYDNDKLDLTFDIKENANVVINEIKEEKNIKIQNKYTLDNNSKLNINKFYDVDKVKELDIVYLNGSSSKVDYNFKVISKSDNKYDMIIYHMNKNTSSNIDNKGITILDGNLKFNVTSIVYNKITGCNLNQKNQIINMNDSICEINPNLLIEEEDVTANHSAYIGNFKEELIFYLESRGINRKDAINLLIKGFLHDENKDVCKILEKYWG